MATAVWTIPTFSFSSSSYERGFPRRRRTSTLCSVAVDRISGGGSESLADGMSVDCVVVGGGVSGLCTAQALGRSHKVLVTEARDRVGGNIITVERDGYLWEEGPNSFQPTDPVLSMACKVAKMKLECPI